MMAKEQSVMMLIDHNKIDSAEGDRILGIFFV
uniref:Uncharacterized protein n=1 Tax=Arundo donax TaxID=35708 RepID=A0A0A9BYT2_ARUDO